MTDQRPPIGPALMLAVTGLTGFLGGHVAACARRRGWQVRALARRPQPPREGVTWVPGALDDADALETLVTGADAVLHVAGVVNARDRAGFVAGNVAGTMALADATARAGPRRLVHVSSLAAREPGLSDYGWSKARAEQVVQASGLDWTIVRPPAIFGPGDTELFELFRMAARGVALLPPAGRMSAIFAPDLADLLCTLCEPGRATDETIAATFEVGDRRTEGWSHSAFARAIGKAMGRRHVSTLAVPGAVLRLAGRADRMIRGGAAKLTPDRAKYMAHPNWVATRGMAPPEWLWQPKTPADDALAMTARWYRREGWL